MEEITILKDKVAKRDITVAKDAVPLASSASLRSLLDTPAQVSAL